MSSDFRLIEIYFTHYRKEGELETLKQEIQPQIQKINEQREVISGELMDIKKVVNEWQSKVSWTFWYQSQNAKRASSQKRHMVISIFLLCNSLILMSIGAGSIRAIKGGLDKVFKIRDRLHRICRQILR